MKNKLGLLLVSLMCFTGCDLNSISSGTSTSKNNSSLGGLSSNISSEIINSSNIINTSSTILSDSSMNVNTGSSVISNSSVISDSNSSSSVVVEPFKYAFQSLESKRTFVNHAAYKAEQESKQDEFKDRTRNYQVGDDNNFSFKPILTFKRLTVETGEVDFITDKDWEFVVNISILNNGEYTPITESSYIESLNKVDCLIDFNEAAIGNTFKVSLYPTQLNPNQMTELDTKWKKEYIFDVVDGYNVYDAKELSYISNDNGNMPEIGSTLPDINYKTVWDQFKIDNGLKVNYYPTKMILHDDILLGVDDIPSSYLYAENEVSSTDSDYSRVVGSLKDYTDIYHRNLSGNETFSLEGNYFYLNTDEIPTVVRSDNEITESDHIISHAQLFKFYGSETSEVSIENIRLIGNSPREGNTALSGGLIMNKVEGGPKFRAYNNIAIRWFITYFPEETQSLYLMEACRAYNNFNSFIYSWGSGDVTIKDSEFKGAGGPVIIQDHINLDSDSKEEKISATKIENSVLESFVTGTEGWFSIVGVDALIPGITYLDTVLNKGGSTFLQNRDGVSYFNLVSVNKSGSMETATEDLRVRGSVDMNGYVFNYGEEGASNPYFGMLYQTATSNPTIPPVFESSAGGMGYTDTKNLYGLAIDGSGVPSITDITTNKNDPIHKGDYLAMYYMGMQIIFEYDKLEA